MKLKKSISSFVLALIIVFAIAKLSTLTSKINSNSVNTIDGSEADREQWLEYLANNQDAIADDSTNVDISTSDKISISNSNDESTILTVTNYAQEVAQAALSGDTFAAPKTKRYTVLVLDASGSMDGVPMEAAKKAAIKFCKNVLSAEGENHIAVVSYWNTPSIARSFSNDLISLESAINGITSGGGTNTNAGLIYKTV